jgi:hypothetical protein
VGALTALAFVLIIGRTDRFRCGKQIACYLGLIPVEESSGERRRLGHITKQGNSLLRFLLVEAAQVTGSAGCRIRSAIPWSQRMQETQPGKYRPVLGGCCHSSSDCPVSASNSKLGSWLKHYASKLEIRTLGRCRSRALNLLVFLGLEPFATRPAAAHITCGQ